MEINHIKAIDALAYWSKQLSCFYSWKYNLKSLMDLEEKNELIIDDPDIEITQESYEQTIFAMTRFVEIPIITMVDKDEVIHIVKGAKMYESAKQVRKDMLERWALPGANPFEPIAEKMTRLVFKSYQITQGNEANDIVIDYITNIYKI